MTESIPDRLFEISQLRKYDGSEDLVYIAYAGIVYDVSGSSRWRNGLHEGLHFPGQELSSELADAPHGEEVFKRLHIKPIGRIINHPPREQG